MAAFVDLDDDDPQAVPQPGTAAWPHSDPTKFVAAASTQAAHTESQSQTQGLFPDNPNHNNSAANALACYPVVLAIASNIDLNTLDSLSRTCRSVHASLIGTRESLMRTTLLCTYEDVAIDPEDTLRFRARAGNLFYMEDMTRIAPEGLCKSGSCARDMVSECRRCSTVVCRNCAIKPPAPIVLKDRHRRLCTACVKAPITSLTKPPLSDDTLMNFTILKNAVCSCPDSVWLCQPCGRSIRSADQEYLGIWRWRNQYGEVLGGLGTGIGEGDRGVICVRGADCQNSRCQEHEIDCEAEDMRSVFDQTPSGPPSPPDSQASEPLFEEEDEVYVGPSTLPGAVSAATTVPESTSREGTPPLGPGYARHEIEGIGRVIKKKLVKIVRIGGCVPEWGDEISRGIVLGREVNGDTRSWCGWCCRVIPSKNDMEPEGKGKGKA